MPIRKPEPLKHTIPIFLELGLFKCGKCEYTSGYFMQLAKHYNDYHLQALVKLSKKFDDNLAILRQTYQGIIKEPRTE